MGFVTAVIYFISTGVIPLLGVIKSKRGEVLALMGFWIGRGNLCDLLPARGKGSIGWRGRFSSWFSDLLGCVHAVSAWCLSAVVLSFVRGGVWV